MKTNSLCLLHQAPTTLLTTTEMKLKVLVNLSYCVRETVIALKKFQERNFTQFDPHVGETSCQIRAYMMFLLQLRLNDKNYVNTLQKEIKKLEVLHRIAIQQIADFQLALNQKNNRNNTQLFNHEKLHAFLQDKNLVFTLSSEAKFLMQAYFLTKFKGKTLYGDSYIDHEKICQDMQIARKLSKKLVHHYQSQVAESSIQFIFDLLRDLPECYELNFILKQLNYRDDDDRSVLPCYPVIKAMLQHMLKNQCSVLIVAKRQFQETEYDHVCLLFEPSQLGNDYQLVLTIKEELTLQGYLLNKACIVIEGLVTYKPHHIIENKKQFVNRFLTVGLIKVILANMANHPQFSGHKLNPASYNPYKVLLSEQNNFPLKYEATNNCIAYSGINDEAYIIYHAEEELLEMKLWGEEVGCCEANPSLFFIRHIFCNSVGEQIAQTYGAVFEDSRTVYSVESLTRIHEAYDSLAV